MTQVSIGNVPDFRLVVVADWAMRSHDIPKVFLDARTDNCIDVTPDLANILTPKPTTQVGQSETRYEIQLQSHLT